MIQALLFNFHAVGNVALKTTALNVLFYVCLLLLVESIQYFKNNDDIILKAKVGLRYFFYYICLMLMMFYGVLGQNRFIYFQF